MSLYPNGCTRCGSYAFNSTLHGRDDTDHDLCDVCYWRKRAEGDDTSIRSELRRAAENEFLALHLSPVARHVVGAFNGIHEPYWINTGDDRQSWFFLLVAEAL